MLFKISQISQKAPVSESLFNKVVGLQACNFIKKRLQHRFFPVNIVTFLRAALIKEQLWGLLLKEEGLSRYQKQNNQ